MSNAFAAVKAAATDATYPFQGMTVRLETQKSSGLIKGVIGREFVSAGDFNVPIHMKPMTDGGWQVSIDHKVAAGLTSVVHFKDYFSVDENISLLLKAVSQMLSGADLSLRSKIMKEQADIQARQAVVLALKADAALASMMVKTIVTK